VGYEIHITRKEFWSDETGPEITSKEWRALTSADSSMRPMRNGDMTWVGYSRHIPGRVEASFHLGERGDVVANRPDREMRAKMHRMAVKIDAKVQGDEGELYDEKGDVIASTRRRRHGLIAVLIAIMALAVGSFAVMIFGMQAALGLLLLTGFVIAAGMFQRFAARWKR
jgi:hypothetical protein